MQAGEYVHAFNAAVRSGDWAELAEWFTEDGVLEFVGPPVGPFVGRAAIVTAYTADPPDDEIELFGPATVEGDTTVVSYRWRASGSGGTLRFTERAGRVQRLVVGFDAAMPH